MILAGREEIERYVNLGEIHLNPALRGLSGILDVVFKVGVACVQAVHRGPGGLTPSESQYNRSKASGVWVAASVVSDTSTTWPGVA